MCFDIGVSTHGEMAFTFILLVASSTAMDLTADIKAPLSLNTAPYHSPVTPITELMKTILTFTEKCACFNAFLVRLTAPITFTKKILHLPGEIAFNGNVVEIPAQLTTPSIVPAYSQQL